MSGGRVVGTSTCDVEEPQKAAGMCLKPPILNLAIEGESELLGPISVRVIFAVGYHEMSKHSLVMQLASSERE
ncbi:uncharacterized protein N7503_004235 [Penicillium pulvis]|uniref:uncharacterized protein n=1 Tax=Penicillium pulvis TaxID=1562058 RepID=UPI002547B0A2|nr:uncharacterized protein N7503_004235 [Penicillium pulvis]KAJ5806633.1 hypothetical protein N7503_004235 [Penicillium pulvis]